MNITLINGLRITTSLRYIQLVKGDVNSVSEDPIGSLLKITFIEGSTSSSVIHPGVQVIENKILIEKYVFRTNNPIIKVNGLGFTKYTTTPHIFRLIIIKDKPTQIFHDESKTFILINEVDKNDNNKYFNLLLDNLIYIRPTEFTSFLGIKNHYNLVMLDRDLEINSNSDVITNSRDRFEDYSLRAIDSLVVFNRELTAILKERDIELLPSSSTKKLDKKAYVKYTTSELPKIQDYKTNKGILRDTSHQKVTINFEFNTPNFIQYTDVLHRYQMIDFITNYTSTYAKDKYGVEWRFAIKWSDITTDFSQDLLNTDNNQNFSFTSTFSCELHFYIKYDSIYSIIQEVILKLNDETEIIP